jgi:hypothetical protein
MSIFTRTSKGAYSAFSQTAAVICTALKPILWLVAAVIVAVAFVGGGYIAALAVPFFFTLGVIEATSRRFKKARAKRLLEKEAAKPAKYTFVNEQHEQVWPIPQEQKLSFIKKLELKRKAKRAFYAEMERYVKLANEEARRLNSLKTS